MNERLKSKTIVLLGMGHTNAHIVRMWRMKPIQDCRLVCISNFPVVTYSGMLPGVLSGQYSPERMEIDALRLCISAGARLIVDHVTSIDPINHQVIFAQRSPLNYDWLSIGIGSEPMIDNVEISAGANLHRIKPMQTFLQRLEQGISRAQQLAGESVIQVFIVGGGAGGLEVSFCLHSRLSEQLGANRFQLHLVNSGEFLGGDLLATTQRKIARELDRRQIIVLNRTRVTNVSDSQIEFEDQPARPAHLTLWATNAQATDLLDHTGLPQDDRGFLVTHATLQSIGSDRVFVVGDSGTLVHQPTPKAGVYAVRQGPVLWQNLQNAAAAQPLVNFQPQRGFLKLLNLGDGRAIGEYKWLALVGKSMWKLKDYIDAKFMSKYQDYAPRSMTMSPVASDMKDSMRCVGCGGKIGGSVLSKVIAGLKIPPQDDVILGLDQPDDAAILKITGGQVTLTTDFFAAPVDDPWLIGRLAALNSASDVFAMGAEPKLALANIEIPYGKPKRQQEELFELLSGAMYEFTKMGATIAGGHTIEGPRLTAGFMIAATQKFPPALKSNLRVGDKIVLTKPLGNGVLLAALMQNKCSGNDYLKLVEHMTQSNRVALDLLACPNVSAITDVTGFGLAGHFLEMLRASNVTATINLDDVGTLDGVRERIELDGIESSLAEQNREVEPEIAMSESARQHYKYQVLFDPQTCGGLLVGVGQNEKHVLQILHQNGFERASVIGEVTAILDHQAIPRLVVR